MLHDYTYRDLRHGRDRAAFSPGAGWGVLRILVVDAATDPEVQSIWDLVAAHDYNLQVLTLRDVGEADRPGDISLLYTPEGRLGGVREIRERGVAQYAIFSAELNSDVVRRRAEEMHFDGNSAAKVHDLVQAAEAMGAELLVTNEPFSLTNKATRKTHAATARDGLAVVGLRQRLSGSGIVGSPEMSMSLGLRSLEIMESWRLLPRTYDLFGGPYTEESERWLSRLRVGFARVQRCLRIRDRILVGAINPEDALPFDSPDALVEGAALQISGMFDSLAVAVSEALDGIEATGWSARFSERSFRRQLPCDLRQVLDQRALNFLTAISLLRNTIHGEPLGPAARSDDHGAVERHMVLVAAEAASLREIFPTLRLGIELGSTDLGELGVALDPVQVVETVLPFAVELFEQVVAATPWPITNERPHRARTDDPVGNPYNFPQFREQNRRYYGLGRFVRDAGSRDR